MVGILTLFGVIWLFQGVRDYFMTEKFANDKKGIIGERKLEYTKGLGKFELAIGVLFVLFDRVVFRYVVGKYSAMLFFIVMIVAMLLFAKWSKPYMIKKE